MTKPKKKPKTGDVVGWVIVDCDGDARPGTIFGTRRDAKADAKVMDRISGYAPFRVAKIVLAK